MQLNQTLLKFCVELAQADLAKLRPGDLMNVKDELSLYFKAASKTIPEIIVDAHLPTTLDELKALQEDVSRILNEIVTNRAAPNFVAESFKLDVEFSVAPVRPKGRSILLVHGSAQGGFLFRLFWLLLHEPTDRILRCRAADCDVIFYRMRKQEYCSTRCANRDYQKSYRADARKNPIEAKLASEKAHERYKKRIQDRRVARRPRKRRP